MHPSPTALPPAGSRPPLSWHFGAPFDGSPGGAWKLSAIVAGVSFATLLLELLASRMLAFFLGNVGSFLAIPVTLYGLGFGSLLVHRSRRGPALERLPALLVALALATPIAFIAFFFLFNVAFNLSHHWSLQPARDAGRVMAYSALLFVPFTLLGMAFTVVFAHGARQIGRLYALDLLAAGLACLLTPLLFHGFSLPVLLFLLFGVLLALPPLVVDRGRARAAALAGAVLAVLGLGRAAGIWLVERPDPRTLGGGYVQKQSQVVEQDSAWNEFARVSLVRAGPAADPRYLIVQDDGISNVHVERFEPSAGPPRTLPVTGEALPFLLGIEPRDVLVIFAGTGKDMLNFYRFTGGRARITGVELNPLVKSLVTSRNDIGFGLDEFYRTPGIDLHIEEGRSFLNRDKGLYDVIFAASNGAAAAVRTGHSRKFLDTEQAMRAYLAHLRPGGVLIFHVQTVMEKLAIFHKIFAEQGHRLDDKVAVLGAQGRGPDRDYGTLLLAPGGLTQEQARALSEFWTRDPRARRTVAYAPGQPGGGRRVGRRVRGQEPDAWVPTDDRPFQAPIDYRAFDLFPSAGQLATVAYSLSWIKVFTLLFFTALVVATTAAFYTRGIERALPFRWLGYFLVTGFAYMCAEIGMMGKLELFLGNPLYAVAVILAGFLLSNGAGAALYERSRARVTLATLAGTTLVVSLLTLLALDALAGHLDWPLLAKVPVVLLVLFPLGTLLGMYYPHGVRSLVDRGLERAVPMTYGLATLSSVLGSTYAMVAIINLGFQAVLLQGAACYAVLAALALLGRRRPVAGPGG